jgi:hypothetical protein
VEYSHGRDQASHLLNRPVHEFLSFTAAIILTVFFSNVNIFDNLYSWPSIVRMIKSRRMRWAGHVALIGEKRNAYRILVGKPEGKRPLGRPRCRWVDNIKMDLRDDVVVWTGLIWLRIGTSGVLL